MSKNPQGTKQEQTATMHAYTEKVKAQVQEAKAKLDVLEATAREKKADAEITAIGGLKTARQNIERKLEDLRSTSEANASRAKAAIDADVASFRTAIEGLAAKIKPSRGAK